MKADISKIRPSVWFVAECDDDIFKLGQLASRFKSSTRGITIDVKVSLEVPILELIELATQDKQSNLEE